MHGHRQINSGGKSFLVIQSGDASPGESGWKYADRLKELGLTIDILKRGASGVT